MPKASEKNCAGCCHVGQHLETKREHTAYKTGPQCRVPFCLCPEYVSYQPDFKACDKPAGNGPCFLAEGHVYPEHESGILQNSHDALCQAMFEAERWDDNDAERFAQRTLAVLEEHGWIVVRKA